MCSIECTVVHSPPLILHADPLTLLLGSFGFIWFQSRGTITVRCAFHLTHLKDNISINDRGRGFPGCKTTIYKLWAIRQWKRCLLPVTRLAAFLVTLLHRLHSNFIINILAAKHTIHQRQKINKRISLHRYRACTMWMQCTRPNLGSNQQWRMAVIPGNVSEHANYFSLTLARSSQRQGRRLSAAANTITWVVCESGETLTSATCSRRRPVECHAVTLQRSVFYFSEILV